MPSVRHRIRFVVTSVCLTLPITFARAQQGSEASSAAPLWDNLGHHHREITTASEQAQKYFDQGLVWTFSFNHDEAIRSFNEVARLDPTSAMAWWGIALCNGPHINNPAMDAEHSKAASDALKKALALQDKASPPERALISALSKRYADPAPADRKPLDEAYAKAMGEVHAANADDADIAVLYAESLMDLQPWDMWTHDGQPKGKTLEVVAILEGVLAKAPDHPGANHLYVHAVEASPLAVKAVPSADRLRTLVPAAGHMVHMPAHIDIRVGNWQKADESNVNAIEADRKYRAVSPKQDFYRFYMAHNHQFLSFAAMMEGKSELALRAAREMIAGVPAEYAAAHAALIDPIVSLPLDALMRFGRWDEILKEPAPPPIFPIATTMWHFVRTIAFAAKGDLPAAEQEKAAFLTAKSKVPADAMFAVNKAKDILEIAEHVVNGEIAFRRGDIEEAVSQLRAGVKIEDTLRYMEPPEWIQPVRHTLGAFLMSARRYEEAEKVYLQDLKYWPENGWSLYGLSECIKARAAASKESAQPGGANGPDDEVAAVEKRFKAAWSRADVKIGSSCLCVSGEKAKP